MLQKGNSHFVGLGEQIHLSKSYKNIHEGESTMKNHFITGIMILLLATCSLQEPTPTDSGVEGQVFIGPVCAVVQVGQECSDQPYQATLTVNSLGGQRIAQVQADSEGRFKIQLQPGEYILHPESPNVLPSAADQTFIVQAGVFTQVVVNYDSGIR